MMKVLIINPSRFYSGDWGRGHLSHLFTIYSYLRTHSPEVAVDVLDLEWELFKPDDDPGVAEFLKLARAALQTTDFDIVGISCWTSLHYLSTVAIAELCKELHPECTVVVGGYHPSSLPGDFSYPGSPFDFVVIGEGEVAFQRIVSGQVPQETHPQIVPGTPVDMEEEVLLWEEYKYCRNARALNIWLARGCPFSCGFCLDRLTKWRGYTPARAVAEIKRMVQVLPRMKQLGILDPIFGLNKAWRRELLDGLIAADLDLEYWAETRVDLMEEEDIRRVGALNFQLDIGLDSVSPRMLTIMMKTKHPDRYIQSFRQTDAWMNRYQVPHLIYTILNYPGETSATLDETLAFWTRYYEEHPGSYGVFSAQPIKFFPGCEVFNNIAAYEAEYGTRVLYPEWWKMQRPTYAELSRRVIPSRELAEAGKLGYEKMVSMNILGMAGATVSDRAHKMLVEKMVPLTQLRVTDFSYFNDMRLRLHEDSHYHKRLNTRGILFNFDNGAQYACTQEETAWVDELLHNGATVGALSERQAAFHPDPQQARRKLETFLRKMITSGFLRAHLEPPEDNRIAGQFFRAAIHTNLGTLEFQLFPEEAPRTVANFVHLTRSGYYNGLFVVRNNPGAYVVMGAYLSRGRGPGYSLPEERSARLHQRGSLSMDISIDASRFILCRRPWPDLDGSKTVFGQMIGGEEVLDRLLKNDFIVRIDITEIPSPLGEEAAVTQTG